MKQLRILVFSATFGAGHLRAADALIEALRGRYPDALIVHLDFVAFVNKTLNRVIKTTYIELIKRCPGLWGKFYTRTSSLQADSSLMRLINGIGCRKYRDYIAQLAPDLIITTHPTMAGVLGELRLTQQLQTPVVTVVTDFTLHGSWFHRGVDLYIVGNQEVRSQLMNRKVGSERIRITGIPVSPRFEKELDRKALAQALGIRPDVLTVLVMGGAYGVLDGLKGMCRILTQSQVPVQTLVVCGRDEKLYRSLEEVLKQAKNPIIPFGYVNNVEELMSVSDLIITKAGGLTVSEALTKRLPMLIYKPIPGQEEENARHIHTIGAGLIAYTQEELEAAIHRLLANPLEVKAMGAAAGKALPGQAACRAMDEALGLLADPYLQQVKA